MSLDVQAAKEVAVLEARRHQSRIELEAATREKKAREDAAKRKQARQDAERDEKARVAQARLQELQAVWADNKVQAEVTLCVLDSEVFDCDAYLSAWTTLFRPNAVADSASNLTCVMIFYSSRLYNPCRKTMRSSTKMLASCTVLTDQNLQCPVASSMVMQIRLVILDWARGH